MIEQVELRPARVEDAEALAALYSAQREFLAPFDPIRPDAFYTVAGQRTELDDLDSHRSTETLPEECDVIIVGAGFAGASIAHYIYENNPTPPRVVILEAREACSGATGRNG